MRPINPNDSVTAVSADFTVPSTISLVRPWKPPVKTAISINASQMWLSMQTELNCESANRRARKRRDVAAGVSPGVSPAVEAAACRRGLVHPLESIDRLRTSAGQDAPLYGRRDACRHKQVPVAHILTCRKM